MIVVIQLNTYDLVKLITYINNAIRKVFKKTHSQKKLDFYLKLLEIHLNNKKNMIELIESMEELIYQKKSN